MLLDTPTQCNLFVLFRTHRIREGNFGQIGLGSDDATAGAERTDAPHLAGQGRPVPLASDTTFFDSYIMTGLLPAALFQLQFNGTCSSCGASAYRS